MTFDEFMKDPVNTLYALNEKELYQIKQKLSADSLKQLKKFAGEAFAIPLQSITFKSKMVIVSDKHEYESFSIYAWPDTTKENGLPYIKKDGYQNPEHLKGDKLALRKVAYAVYYLALLYYLTNEEKYYRRMAEQLECFFINEETKMNPNLDHGQAMPGVNDGQRGGIIDFAVSFGYSLAMLECLKSRKMLKPELIKGFKPWLQSLKVWLLTSRFDHEMEQCPNNHALVYDYLLLVISEFLDDYYHLTLIRQRYLSRMEEQILENGLMAQELKRVNSRSYYFMNLKLFVEIGKLLNLDLTRYPLLKTAMTYYLTHNQSAAWEFSQEKTFPEEYDNYMLYTAKMDFKMEGQPLRKASSLQYILFKDVYGEGNEKS